ncbi:ATP-dependent helicase [Helicobacter ailurogastricus]|uniref:ATP-dependent helicase n=1 Tax=Helicobacter ailurogastricus TaxID=1578720 RepID=UPI000CF0C589|nr:ATP-dependent helicase [Helicobacter ailurogastricus]GLH57639.1 hypothetical protein NHP214376_04260 [Helicobacter ailurogastricus]GLH59753.1 hypothetical protein NHP214377_10220 [Helicobacter ailurogastricus]
MNAQALLASLNPAQQEAARHIKGPLLILAGAGSGKTRTLTTRLAYLIGCVGIPPENTLTLTFTNKAAREMRQRAMDLLGRQHTSYKPTLCTFHSFGHALLREHHALLDLPPDFQVVTQETMGAKLPEILGKPLEERTIKGMFKKFSQVKNQCVPLKSCWESVQWAFVLYNAFLRQNGLVDFDDLIALPYALLEKNLALAKSLGQRYAYISVDEYQDTNPLQFKLLQKLCGTHQNLCVVGDDDQSIYGFRGADVRNILAFEHHFKGAKVIKLEQNYRSTQNILECANQLIKHNRQRHNKTLFSDKAKAPSQKLKFLHFANADAENIFLVQQIQDCLNRGIAPQNIAILYRLHCLAKKIHEGLKGAHILHEILRPDDNPLENYTPPPEGIRGVQCMSVHTSKGLEFSVVFLVGFEEDFFPYGGVEDIEEERRLCYVAITRAKEELYICSAKERCYFDKIYTRLEPSSFLEEAQLHLQAES